MPYLCHQSCCPGTEHVTTWNFAVVFRSSCILSWCCTSCCLLNHKPLCQGGELLFSVVFTLALPWNNPAIQKTVVSPPVCPLHREMNPLPSHPHSNTIAQGGFKTQPRRFSAWKIFLLIMSSINVLPVALQTQSSLFVNLSLSGDLHAGYSGGKNKPPLGFALSVAIRQKGPGPLGYLIRLRPLHWHDVWVSVKNALSAALALTALKADEVSAAAVQFSGTEPRSASLHARPVDRFTSPRLCRSLLPVRDAFPVFDDVLRRCEYQSRAWMRSKFGELQDHIRL